MAKLIVDSGSTKMHLALIHDGGAVEQWEQPGVNALTASADELAAGLRGHALPQLHSVHFYGAGVATESVAEKVRGAMPPARQTEVCSDLLGAARALFGSRSGVAVILGTGSNSGQYDGHEIVCHIPPLGYVLGDECSGAALGKAVLRHIYRHNHPIRSTFEAETGLNYQEVLDLVYRQPGANRFLASIVPFLKRHLQGYPPFAALLAGQMELLAQECLGYYPQNLPVGFVGGVAKAFENEIKEFFSTSLVMERPMPGLIKYHSEK